MPLQVASLFGVLRLDDSDFKTGLKDAKTGLGGLTGNLQDVSKRVKAFGGGLQDVGGIMTTIGAPFLAFGGLAIKAFGEGEQAAAQLDAVLRSTGGAAGVTRDAVLDFASAMQKVTLFDDESITNAQSLMLTFTNIGSNVFPDATRAALDMSQAMGQDLKSSVIQIGKALNDPVEGLSALSRVGVTFTKQQEDQIKALVASGNAMEAQKMILAELNREFGGSAEAAGNTFVGSLVILKNRFGDLTETIGAQLVPDVQKVVGWLGSLIDRFDALSPEAKQTIINIGKVAAVIGALGPVVIGAGKAVSMIGTVIGILSGPIGLIGVVVGGLFLAFQSNFLGIRDLLQPIIDNVVGGFQTLIGVIGNFQNIIQGKGIGEAIASIINAFMQMLGLVENDKMSPAAQEMGNGIISAFLTVVTFIQNKVLPVLQSLANWFINDALPAVVGFVTGTVIPAIQSFFTFLGNAWAVVGPVLGNIANWFINDALPAIVGFVKDTVIPGVQDFINLLIGIWDAVSPALGDIFNWFMTTGLPAVRDFIVNTVIPGVQDFIDILQGIWTVISPGLESLRQWFVDTALPAIQTAIGDVQKVWGDLQKGLAELWDFVKPKLEPIIAWFRDTFQKVTDFIQPVLDFIGNIITQAGVALDQLRQLGGGAPQTVAGPQLPSGFQPTFGNVRDSGGQGMSGMPYLIGTGAQPELFVPSSSGTFYPNADQMLGSGITITGNVIVYANDPQDFMSKLQAEARRVGA